MTNRPLNLRPLSVPAEDMKRRVVVADERPSGLNDVLSVRS
jgi:hypothetical protein